MIFFVLHIKTLSHTSNNRIEMLQSKLHVANLYVLTCHLAQGYMYITVADIKKPVKRRSA